ncbi:uncharacterized protein LOC136076303 [Hydra vulgaris]|uniref:Uncharacterized protein LOC136076303 n=1 Tax=Hydra vulgaris TaxID=6087 RepID=A0ABM4BAB1_HYDVU
MADDSDTIGSARGAEESSRARVRCVWAKFIELYPLLAARGASLKIKGKLYTSCVESVMMYGSETWALKVEGVQCSERTENDSQMDVRWFGYVDRKDADDWVSACRELEVSGEKGRGKSRKTYRECVAVDLKKLKLRKEDAQDCVY